MKVNMPPANIDKNLELLKLAELHSQCSFDLELELKHIITECADIDYLLTHLAPLLRSSTQDIQSYQAKLRSIQRKMPQKSPESAQN